MYNSQYYTCEQIDQRLLQGYLDDYNSQNNTNLTKAEFLALLFNTIGRNSTVDNLVTQIGYYECDTNGSTAAKAINVANYALFAGGSIKVKFINKNTANNATLNINSQGAKALYYQGERASATNSWDDNEVVEIYYDGTSYYANNINGGSGSGVYDVSKEHPTSGPNGDGKFTLEYILNSSNVNELIPVNKREPGMTIQFVSTSDNKYVCFNLLADEFTTDTTQWAVDDGGVYVENPEYVCVKTDKNGKVLWAIEKNGNIHFGAGVPQQIIDYVTKKIDELSLDEYEDIVSFLNGLEEGDKTLQQLLNEKVDKEEGKSLIDENIANGVSYIENPEFINLEVDTNNKILGGRKHDGKKFENVGFETPNVSINGIITETNNDIEERINICLSKEKKVISYRDKKGILHEEAGIETSSINLNKKGIRFFRKNILNYSLFGKNVAIIGDSISTHGNDGIDPNVAEIVIGTQDVGKTLSAYVTREDVDAGLSINGTSYTFEDIGEEVTFTPSINDVGKKIGTPLSYYTNNMGVWWTYVRDFFDCHMIPVCWSGSGLTRNRLQDLGKYYTPAYAWHESQIRKCGIRKPGTMERKSPDVIIIQRGGNDWSHSPYAVLTDGYFDNYNVQYPDTDLRQDGKFGFKEAYFMTIGKLREAYPFARIILCTYPPLKRGNYSHFPTNNGIHSIPQYNNAVREIANFCGCHVIEFDKCGITFENMYPTYISDNAETPVHPNIKGQEVMGACAIEFLKSINFNL